MSAARRIAVVRSYPKDAALGKVLASLAKEHRVTCYIWDRQHDFQPSVIDDNVSYVRCGISAGFYDLRTFLKLFLFEWWVFFKLLFARIDCAHAIDLDTGFVTCCAAKLKGIPFVYQCLDPYYCALPGHWPPFLANLAKWLENFVITRSDLFVITDLLRMPQHEGARPKKVIEFANVPYLDVTQFKAEATKHFVAGYIGSLTEGRNLLTMIEAVGELEREGVQLIIGGFGPLGKEVQECAARFGNITFYPWVPYEELLKLESGFDLFIQVLDKDDKTVKWGAANPNKLFESMAFGKPIIIGAGTLTEQKVAAIGNGVAVPYGSKRELKDAIMFFKHNSETAREMGEKGKTEFERNWTMAVMTQRLLEAYASLRSES